MNIMRLSRQNNNDDREVSVQLTKNIYQNLEATIAEKKREIEEHRNKLNNFKASDDLAAYSAFREHHQSQIESLQKTVNELTPALTFLDGKAKQINNDQPSIARSWGVTYLTRSFSGK